jgi:hypothetical protein
VTGVHHDTVGTIFDDGDTKNGAPRYPSLSPITMSKMDTKRNALRTSSLHIFETRNAHWFFARDLNGSLCSEH